MCVTGYSLAFRAVHLGITVARILEKPSALYTQLLVAPGATVRL